MSDDPTRDEPRGTGRRQEDDRAAAPASDDGARTASGGTPMAVDVAGDRRARRLWLAFLAGPLIWLSHFAVVYLVAEAGCTGGGPGLRLLGPPVPTVVTIVATVAAVTACATMAVFAYRWWRGDEPPMGEEPPGHSTTAPTPDGLGHTLAFTGFLLSILFAIAVLAVGTPAVVLGSC